MVAAFKAVVAAVMFATTDGFANTAESKFVYKTFELKPPAARYASKEDRALALAEATSIAN